MTGQPAREGAAASRAPAPRRARASPLLVIFLTVFLDLLAFGMILPIIPFYSVSFGVSEAWAGVLMASYSLAQFLFAPLWGKLSDRVGRRPVILASVAGSVVSLTAFGLAQSFWMLLAARTLAGVAGANISAAQAYVADVTTRENRAKGMGVVGAAIGMGFVLGPGFGGFLGQWGYAAPALAAAGLSAVNLVLAWFLLPESRVPGAPPRRDRWRVLDLDAFRASLKRPVVGPLLVAGFLVMVAFSAMEASFSFWARDVHGWGHTETGYLFMYLGVILAVVQGGLIGPLTRRFRERRLLLAGVAGTGIGLALIPLSTALPLLLVTIALLALANGLTHPSMNGLLSLHTASDEQGGVFGLSQGLASLARVIGPLWGTLAFLHLGRASPFLVGALVMAAAAAVLLVVRSQAKRAEAAPAAPPLLQ